MAARRSGANICRSSRPANSSAASASPSPKMWITNSPVADICGGLGEARRQILRLRRRARHQGIFDAEIEGEPSLRAAITGEIVLEGPSCRRKIFSRMSAGWPARSAAKGKGRTLTHHVRGGSELDANIAPQGSILQAILHSRADIAFGRPSRCRNRQSRVDGGNRADVGGDTPVVV